MVLYEVIVAGRQPVIERRLQSRITLAHIQGIRIVGDVQQVRHRRLTARTPVFHTQLLLAVPAVTEVHGGGYIEHVAHRVGIVSVVALHEMRTLGLQQHTQIQLILRLYDAQCQAQVMDIVRVFRETAQRITLVSIQRMVKLVEIVIPSPVAFIPHVEDTSLLIGSEGRSCHQRIIA